MSKVLVEANRLNPTEISSEYISVLEGDASLKISNSL